ncbi:hypothetical protein KAW18_07300 [candidate division WOR-3 bacterium]|nr:hypothetical protein [candidate division WOR-3 bacterium]MCK4527162.1 hypothetical protein [candidate division WOR-3 bacterium]
MKRSYCIIFFFPFLIFANVFMYSHFDSMPPRIIDTLEIPYPLSYYNWIPSVTSDTLSPISIIIHEEFSPLVDEEYRFVANTLFHGKYSLMIKDTLSDTFAYATHKFPDIRGELPEYMVEFYIWVNTVDCKFYLYEPLFDGEERDCYLALVRDSIYYEGSKLMEDMEFEARYGDEIYDFIYTSPVYRITLPEALTFILI